MKRMVIPATILLVLSFAISACMAQTGFGNTAPKAISSTVSSSDNPQKGSISLDLQVDEDSSVFTKTVMVKLENLTASEVEPFVRKSLSKYGSVSTNSNANLLVITDREPKLSDLVAFVKDMDRLGMENFVRLETEVVKLTTAQASTLVDIVRPRLSSDGSIQANDTLNVLVITDVQGKIDYVKDAMEQSTESGMMTFDQSLFKLYKEGKISREEAIKNADSKNNVGLQIRLSEGTGVGAGKSSGSPIDLTIRDEDTNRGRML